MLNLCIALYTEAQPFIEQLQLKKDERKTHFQIFEGEDARLILTGAGEIPAAVVVTYLLTQYPMGKTDLLWNVGIAAGNAEKFGIGTCCICHKITEQTTNRTFYPELLFQHPFAEAEIQTRLIPAQKGIKEEVLVDMEAAGIYQAAQPFCQVHQLGFFKVVSDWADGKRVTTDQARRLIAMHAKDILCLAQQVQQSLQVRRGERFTALEQQEIDCAAAEHGLSLTQRRYMEQMVYYDKLQGGSVTALLSQMPKRMEPGKQEGKRYLEQLRTYIL